MVWGPIDIFGLTAPHVNTIINKMMAWTALFFSGSVPVYSAIFRLMGKSMSHKRRITDRETFVEIINDTYLYETNREARYALEAVSCALRNWLLAMSNEVPTHTQRSLSLPGVGTFRIGWREYNNHPPRIVLRFSPIKDVKKILDKQNKAAYEQWKAEHADDTPNGTRQALPQVDTHRGA
jgi:hypothetical protein